MREFMEALQEVEHSKEYADFRKDYPGYYLAHGFCQLDNNFQMSKTWQIGYYHPEKDNLAVFATNPTKRLPFEDAFKDGGTILRLDSTNIITTDKAIKLVKEVLSKDHSQEIVNTVIVIVQNVGGENYYNITVVTASFAMISIRIDAKTGTIQQVNKRSILDLQQKED